MLKSILLSVLLVTLYACSGTKVKVDDSPRDIKRIEALISYLDACDGGLCRVAVRMLYDELVIYPLAWYEAMADDTASLDRFLYSLEPGVFTVDDSTELEGIVSEKSRQLDALRVLEVPRSLLPVHKKLLEALEAIKPRVID